MNEIIRRSTLRQRPGQRTRSAGLGALLAAMALVHPPSLRAQSTASDSLPAGRSADRPAGAAPTAEAPNPAPEATATPASAPAPGLASELSVAPDASTPLPSVLADTGTHVYELSPDESDDVRAAIERTVAHMNFIARPIARRRLIRANRPPALLTLDVRPDTVAVTFAGLNPIVTPITGAAVPWTRGTTGETYAVFVAFGGDTLRQTIADDDGKRENTFIFLDNGATVEMHVRLTANRLPMPLQYVETFREIRGQPDRTPP